MRTTLAAVTMILLSQPSMAQEASSHMHVGEPAGQSSADAPVGHDTPYAGLQAREIAALSAADIEELRRGGGWGLALPAELNGAPGPAHLLDLKDELGLAPDQVEAIERSFAEMQVDAIAAGERLIGAEAALDAAFVAGELDDARLRALIGEAEAARAKLRLIHLSRHLSTPPLLTAEQIAQYQVLRGYAPE